LEGEVGFDLVGADIYGLHVGPSQVVLRARQGHLALDPIDTTLNGGRIQLEPEILSDENGMVLRLGPSSAIRDAEINDEVSRRFLSYVAPVLDRATRAHGRVSVDLNEAVFPLSNRAKKGTSVVGSVVFDDVEFAPGPLANELYDLIGKDAERSVKLDHPISLSIENRRVYQHGLALPIGRLTQIELEGWVDFDRNLALMASLPLTPAMVGNQPLLGSIVAGAKIRVPITGSLDKPAIDRQVLNLALRDLGKTLLERGAIQGAAALLQRLTQGRDPNAPPPLTRQQRREQRQERKAQRRRDPGIEP
jgi:translocation and assembly module TamB